MSDKVDRSRYHRRPGRHDARSMRADAPAELDRLLASIRACRRCVEAPDGSHCRMSRVRCCGRAGTARLAVCSQAPGTRVHASGIPFTDASGDRLRDWMGVTPAGVLRRGPRRHRAHGVLLSRAGRQGRRPAAAERMRQALASRPCSTALPQLELVLAVGSYAQRLHLGDGGGSQSAGDHARLAEASAAQERARASCRCRIPPGATMAGSSAIPGSRTELLPVLRREVRTTACEHGPEKTACSRRKIFY